MEVNGANWTRFPSTNGTIQGGAGGTSGTVTYSSKSVSGGRYYFNFSPSYNFQNGYATNTTVSISGSSSYSYPYPINNTEAMSTDFLNNLTSADEEILKSRLGLMPFTGNLPSSFNINVRNQITISSPHAPPFT